MRIRSVSCSAVFFFDSGWRILGVGAYVARLGHNWALPHYMRCPFASSRTFYDQHS